jgi:hypothetical protein
VNAAGGEAHSTQPSELPKAPEHASRGGSGTHRTCSRPSRPRTSGTRCAGATRPPPSAAPRPATAAAAARPFSTLQLCDSMRASAAKTSTAAAPPATASAQPAPATREPPSPSATTAALPGAPLGAAAGPGAAGSGGGGGAAGGGGNAQRMRSAAARCACERAASAGSSAGSSPCRPHRRSLWRRGCRAHVTATAGAASDPGYTKCSTLADACMPENA